MKPKLKEPTSEQNWDKCQKNIYWSNQKRQDRLGSKREDIPLLERRWAFFRINATWTQDFSLDNFINYIIGIHEQTYK